MANEGPAGALGSLDLEDPTGSWMVYFTQVPLAIYFLVSLQDIPLDLAIQRLCTCYGLPLALLVAFSYSPIYGVAACIVLWYAFTEAVPFAPIRLPSGLLRQSIFSLLQSNTVTSAPADQEAPEANLFAVSVYVKMVQPFVRVVNHIGDALSPPRPKRTLVGSDISWLFVAINFIDRWLFRFTGYHLVVPYSWRGMQKKAKAVRTTPEINSEPDETAKAVALFLGDMDKSVIGVSATGRLLINNLILGMLDLRGGVQRYIGRHMEIVNIPINTPIVILGMPRTGSTYLQALLAQDPRARHLRFWEMSSPLPPVEREKYNTDQRIDQVQAGLESIDLVSPTYRADMNKYHAFHSRAIEEELVLLHHHMMMLSHFYLTDDANGNSLFTEWLFDENNKGAMYRYFRRYLQLLSYRYKAESHWVLKAPLHALYIKALVREFPDVRIINTHRDPKDIIASWTKFQFQMLSIYLEIDADPAKSFARHTLNMCTKMVDRVMAMRDSMPPDEERRRFADVRMDRLTSDPIGTVRDIYKQFDLQFTPEYEAALKVYVAEHGDKESSAGRPAAAAAAAAASNGNTTPAPSAHAGSLAKLGLSEEDVDRRFARYRARYLS